MPRVGRTTAGLLGCWLMLVSQVMAADPLFNDALFNNENSPLRIRLGGPFETIRYERDKAASYPATLTHDNQVYHVSLSVRGNRRLNRQVCQNPPLWIDFDKDEREGSLFDHQKHIKLVVMCKRGDKYRDYLRGEFLLYRLLNTLTDDSFRVRWVDVTYVEDGRERLESAFFIERKQRLAKRRGYENNDRPAVSISELASPETALASLFQYVIANPDYSFRQGPDPADDCCHNAKLLVRPGGDYVPVPYDFDSSGIINTEYTLPNHEIGVRRVTQRLYRGDCAHNDALSAARDHMLGYRTELVNILKQDPELRANKSKRMSAYLERSLDILSDQTAFNREILADCRGPA